MLLAAALSRYKLQLAVWSKWANEALLWHDARKKTCVSICFVLFGGTTIAASQILGTKGTQPHQSKLSALLASS